MFLASRLITPWLDSSSEQPWSWQYYLCQLLSTVLERRTDRNEVDPLLCPTCGGQMRIISFIEEPKVIDRIIRYLKLTFQAERPPPPQVVQQQLLVAAEERGKYF